MAVCILTLEVFGAPERKVGVIAPEVPEKVSVHGEQACSPEFGHNIGLQASTKYPTNTGTWCSPLHVARGWCAGNGAGRCVCVCGEGENKREGEGG